MTEPSPPETPSPDAAGPDRGEAGLPALVAPRRASPSRRAPVIEHGAGPPPWWRPPYPFPAILAAIAVGGLLLGGTGAWVWMLNQPGRAAFADSHAPRPASDSARDLGSDAALWARTDRADPLALTEYLLRYPAGHFAGEAMALRDRMDTDAWTRIGGETTFDGRLNALNAYDVQFPNAVHGLEADGLRTATLDAVEDIERGLDAQGFGPGPIDGVITPDTGAAVARFQKARALPVTGVLDASLLAQVAATTETTPAMIDARPSAPVTESTSPTASATSIVPQTPAPISTQTVASPTPAAPDTRAPAAFRDCFVCPQMRALPLGRATLGDLAGDGDRDEAPVHEVSITRAIAVGVYEVTFDEWDACVSEGGCSHRPASSASGRGTRPVTDVSWRDTRQYVAWLGRKTGKRYRLLSEAEWEYAARAGARTRYAHGDDVAGLCAVANHADASSAYAWRNRACADGYAAQAAPVGSFRANAFGLHDMAGNVWEWVDDCWHDSYVGAPANGAAWTADCVGANRILRGGAWSVKPAYVRAAYRYAFAADARMPFFGFRVARAMD